MPWKSSNTSLFRYLHPGEGFFLCIKYCFNHDALNLNGEFNYIITIVGLRHRYPYTYSSKSYKTSVRILFNHTNFHFFQFKGYQNGDFFPYTYESKTLQIICSDSVQAYEVQRNPIKKRCTFAKSLPVIVEEKRIVLIDKTYKITPCNLCTYTNFLKMSKKIPDKTQNRCQ